MFRKFVAVLLLVLNTGAMFQLGIQTRAGTPDTKPRVQSADRKIAHVLTRLTFGARPGDFEHVKAIGVEKFIAQQLDFESISDTNIDDRLRKLPTLSLGTPDLIEQYTPPKPSPSPSPSASPAASPTMSPMDQKPAAQPLPGQLVAQNPGMVELKTEVRKEGQPATKPPVKNQQLIVTELQRAALLRAVYSERQLFELMVKFWENHFSVFASKDADRFFMTEFDRDAIRPFALGNFRDLLGATTRSSAMLFYLDNWQSSVPRQYPATKDRPARTSGGINENYARELMELHTLGVDGGYTQKDVQEVARCFTGWTIRKPNEVGLFFFNPRTHDNGEKLVLGHKIPAGGGISDGEKVLDILASHPATANFIATKLARRFISDEPPPTVINRAAATFLKTDGSIVETLRAIITSPEFFAPDKYRAKVRTPFEYVAAAMRAVSAESDADPSVIQLIGRMGQPVFGRVTPDGYPDRAEQWLSAGSMLERFNFAVALTSNRLKGTRVGTEKILNQSGKDDPATLADYLAKLILVGDVREGTRQAIESLVKAEPAAGGVALGMQLVDFTKNPGSAKPVPAFISSVLSMTLGSPEFQRR